MPESGVKEAALRLRALADRCGLSEDAVGAALHEAQVDAVIERRLAEQAAAIAELSRQVDELSELIRSSVLAMPHQMVSAGSDRAGRQALMLLTAGAAVLGLVGWAWARDDLSTIVAQALRLAGVAVGS
jgi:hypothetical protein